MLPMAATHHPAGTGPVATPLPLPQRPPIPLPVSIPKPTRSILTRELHDPAHPRAAVVATIPLAPLANLSLKITTGAQAQSRLKLQARTIQVIV